MQSAVGLEQIYLDKRVNNIKQEAFVMFPVHVVLLNFSTEFRGNVALN